MKKAEFGTDLLFLSESLCRHSHYVLDYCRSSWSNLGNFKPGKRIEHINLFIVDAENLVVQLETMLDKAKLLQTKGYLNFEQLEAEIDMVKRIIAKARMELIYLSDEITEKAETKC